MSMFQWTPDLDVEVEAMNDEHKKLIDLMNLLYAQCDSGKSKDELARTLDALAKYTEKHFANEEQYMTSIGFNGLATHALIHKDLIGKLQKHQADFMSSGVLAPSFFDFLKLWLTAHIRGIDRKYSAHAEHLNAQMPQRIAG